MYLYIGIHGNAGGEKTLPPSCFPAEHRLASGHREHIGSSFNTSHSELRKTIDHNTQKQRV